MKPFKADKIDNVRESLLFIDARTELLESILRAMEDTATSTAGEETDRDTLNRLQALVKVMEDQVDLLKEEVYTASEVALREQKGKLETA